MREPPGTWYQAYLPADRSVIGPMLDRLKAAEVPVLVVTVDVQIASTQENELRNGFSIPLRFTPRPMAGGLMRPRWMAETFARTLLRQGIPHFENLTATRRTRIITAAKGDHRAGRAARWATLCRLPSRQKPSTRIGRPSASWATAVSWRTGRNSPQQFSMGSMCS